MRTASRGCLSAFLLVLATFAHEARAGGIAYYYGPTSYAPPVYYAAPVYPAPVYAVPVAPVTVYRPVYVPPVYQPVARPVVPVVYSAPAAYPVRVRYKRREIETKYYTPYGTYEYEVKFDRWGNVRDVDVDFDD